MIDINKACEIAFENKKSLFRGNELYISGVVDLGNFYDIAFDFVTLKNQREEDYAIPPGDSLGITISKESGDIVDLGGCYPGSNYWTMVENAVELEVPIEYR